MFLIQIAEDSHVETHGGQAPHLRPLWTNFQAQLHQERSQVSERLRFYVSRPCRHRAHSKACGSRGRREQRHHLDLGSV